MPSAALQWAPSSIERLRVAEAEAKLANDLTVSSVGERRSVTVDWRPDGRHPEHPVEERSAVVGDCRAAAIQIS
jgi:hypothetical protein